jgi:hypothetical protein
MSIINRSLYLHAQIRVPSGVIFQDRGISERVLVFVGSGLKTYFLLHSAMAKELKLLIMKHCKEFYKYLNTYTMCTVLSEEIPVCRCLLSSQCFC